MDPVATEEPLEGTSLEVDVERLAYGGDGVARSDGLVVFIPWTAPGDRVRTVLLERRPSFARGRLERVIDPGPDRVAPGCPVYGVCGGCRLQHLDASAQRRAKARAVGDALQRIAGRAVGTVACVPARSAWHYRQRVVFTWRGPREGGTPARGLVAGFHAAADPAVVVPVHACPITAEPANRAYGPLAQSLAAGLDDAVDGGEIEGRLVLRTLPGRVQAGIFTADDALARALAGRCAEETGLEVTWGHWSTERPLALGEGAPRLETRLAYRGLDLRVGFDSFLQVDLESAEALYDAVLEAADVRSGDGVVDGYAGIGIVTCHLAGLGARVTAIESHPGAASDLRANAARAEGPSVHVLELPAERVDWARPRPRIVIVNPPRSGCPPRALASIGRSGATRLVYVACDPTTLARDIERLGPAWRLESVRAFDIFPQTAHVETVARLDRDAG